MSTESPLTILALSGSLRAQSYNTALARAAATHVPDGVTVVVHDYADVPLYNADLGEPHSVARLKAAIKLMTQNKAGHGGPRIANSQSNQGADDLAPIQP